ncbi:MAG: hypothetical protein ACM31C_00225 [Acidobacteriota bacterium]
MRALAAIVLLAGSARAGDFFEPPSPMTRLRQLPVHARLVETRTIAGLGQVWRYAVAGAPDTIVLAADGAWWVAPPIVLGAGQGMGGSFDEVDDFRTRIDARMIDGRVGLAITVEARSRLCHGRGAGDDPDKPVETTCEEPTPVAATLVCTRAERLECEFVPTQ